MDKLSHIDDKGRASMVDVGGKPIQNRIAKAKGSIILQPKTLTLIEENRLTKGDVLAVSKIAGIQAAKLTSNLIPLCHNIALNNIDLEFRLTEKGIDVFSTVQSQGKTGAEMEALTAVSVALLTIYDMCKAVDTTMQITEVLLVEKTKTDINT